jgi:non-specific serine/threonine protein kinase
MHTGDLAAALPLLDEALERAEALPDAPIALALATLCRGAAALADGDPIQSDAMAARSREVSRAYGDRWWLNYGLCLSIPGALMLGDVARATAYGRESLSGCAALGDTNGLTLTLEFVAWTAAADGDPGRAARLLGVADQQAGVNGGNPTAAGLYRPAHDQCEATARAELGAARFEAEFRTGAQLTLDEAIAYANRNGPTPDPRRAPTSRPPGDGPPHLTKRELEIARLLTEGLTNKQISQQLVIAQRTVESHVENILNKRGFTTRTQIASWMLAREEDADGEPDGPGLP